MLNYGTGDHVVCINDDFPNHVKAFYAQLPVRGQSYVVRDIRLGVTFQYEGDISVLLVGLVNPKADSKANLERGFMASRFRKPEEANEIVKNIEIKPLEQITA